MTIQQHFDSFVIRNTGKWRLDVGQFGYIAPNRFQIGLQTIHIPLCPWLRCDNVDNLCPIVERLACKVTCPDDQFVVAFGKVVNDLGGGNGIFNENPSGSGGGGSGGVIYLAAPAIDVATGAIVSARGGPGGTGGEPGGAGGLGRVRLSVGAGTACSLLGTFTPALATTASCKPNSSPATVYVADFPN